MSHQHEIEKLSIRDGQSIRAACPGCGGRDTLSVTKEAGELKWLCFKASCNVRGRAGVKRSREDVRNALTERRDATVREFSIPPHWTSPMSDEDAVRYMRRFHVMDAYGRGDADLMFDPKQRRVIFLVYDDKHRVVDAVGRALSRKQQPKWFRYGSSGYPFICGNHETAVIVEDAASACAVSGIATGVALLGTRFQSTHLAPLRRFSNAIIALDRDAARKSLEMSRFVRYFVPVEVRVIEDDLKEFDEAGIRQQLDL